MKNIKTITIAALLVAVVLAPLFAFKGQQDKTETVTDTKCFINQNMGVIKVYIESYAKQGYTVKTIASQAVSVSINKYYNPSNRVDVKGDIILVLEKQKTITHK